MNFRNVGMVLVLFVENASQIFSCKDFLRIVDGSVNLGNIDVMMNLGNVQIKVRKLDMNLGQVDMMLMIVEMRYFDMDLRGRNIDFVVQIDSNLGNVQFMVVDSSRNILFHF